LGVLSSSGAPFGPSVNLASTSPVGPACPPSGLDSTASVRGHGDKTGTFGVGDAVQHAFIARDGGIGGRSAAKSCGQSSACLRNRTQGDMASGHYSTASTGARGRQSREVRPTSGGGQEEGSRFGQGCADLRGCLHGCGRACGATSCVKRLDSAIRTARWGICSHDPPACAPAFLCYR